MSPCPAPERTLHLTSLSKTLTPGLRWGAVAGPAPLINRIGGLIRATVFNPAPLAMQVARRWLENGTAVDLLAWQRTEMRTRFDAVEALLADCPAVRSVRTAGLHAWLDLNDPWTPGEVIDVGHRLNVEIGSSAYFTPTPAHSIANPRGPQAPGYSYRAAGGVVAEGGRAAQRALHHAGVQAVGEGIADDLAATVNDGVLAR